ncbi:MAG: arginase family protein [Vicinamibacterales bacterium]
MTDPRRPRASAWLARADDQARLCVLGVPLRLGSITPGRSDLARAVVDIDVLDRTFVPATPGSRPGGLAPWQLRAAARLCGRHPKVRAADLVEIDPEEDISDRTTLAAATLLSFAAGVLEREPTP